MQSNEELLTTNSDGRMLVKTANYYEGEDKEEPSDDELRFLQDTTEKLREWLEEYTYKRMEKRTCYTQEFVDKTKQLLKDYAPGGKWAQTGKLKLQTYQEIRILMLAEGSQLIKKIEKKIDKTRQGYELYTVAGPLRKVNDERLLIPLERDFIAEWWPRAFDLEGLWQFSARPLTKKMIEEWENGRPLQSCIFCPSEAGMASTRSDDFVFDKADLLYTTQSKEDKEWKEAIITSTAAYLANEARKFNEGIIEEGGKGLSDLNALQNMHASALAGRIELMENAINFTEEKSTKETLKAYTQICSGEISRRKEELNQANQEKDKLEKEKEELDKHRVRLENEIEQTKQDREAIKEDVKKKEAELESEKNKLDEKVRKQDEIITERARTKSDFDTFKLQLDQNKTAINNLTDRSSEADRTNLRNEQDRLRQKTDDLERKLGEHDRELDQINNEIRGIQGRIDLLNDNIHRNHTNIAHNTGAINALEEKLGRLQQRQGELERENNVLRTKLGEMERPGYIDWNVGGVPPTSTASGSSTTQSTPGSFYLEYTVKASSGGGFSGGGIETIILDSITYAESFAHQVRYGSWVPNCSGVGWMTTDKKESIYRDVMDYVRRCKAGENIHVVDGGANSVRNSNSSRWRADD